LKVAKKLKPIVKCETFEQLVAADEELAELFKQRYQLEVKIKEVEQRRQNIILRGLPQPIWGWGTKVYIADGREVFGPEEGTEVVRVNKVILNYDDLIDVYDLAGVRIENVDDHNKGMNYYRKNQVLLKFGGGTAWLFAAGPHPIVTDEEWFSIKRGVIPSRLVK